MSLGPVNSDIGLGYSVVDLPNVSVCWSLVSTSRDPHLTVAAAAAAAWPTAPDWSMVYIDFVTFDAMLTSDDPDSSI